MLPADKECSAHVIRFQSLPFLSMVPYSRTILSIVYIGYTETQLIFRLAPQNSIADSEL